MMYEHDGVHQQPQHMRRRMERQKSIEEESLEIVDLSGMSLESLPCPSLNLGTICKLDLSSNNLQVFYFKLIFSTTKTPPVLFLPHYHLFSFLSFFCIFAKELTLKTAVLSYNYFIMLM
jgi:hypothetical protein